MKTMILREFCDMLQGTIDDMSETGHCPYVNLYSDLSKCLDLKHFRSMNFPNMLISARGTTLKDPNISKWWNTICSLSDKVKANPILAVKRNKTWSFFVSGALLGMDNISRFQLNQEDFVQLFSDLTLDQTFVSKDWIYRGVVR